MKKISLCLLLLFLFSNVTFSQFNRYKNNHNNFTDRKNYYNFGKKFYSEVHYLPYKKDSSNVVLFFRMTYDLLSFEKYAKPYLKKESFFALPTIEAEFEDTEGIIRKRIVWQDTIFTDDFSKTISKTDFIKGKLTATISDKNYNVTVRLSDKTNHNIRKMIFKDSIPHNFLSKNIIAKPIFTYAGNTHSDIFYPYVSNNINFSSKSPIILIPVSYRNEFVKYHYSCIFLNSRERNGLKWKSDLNISGLVVPRKQSTLEIDNYKLKIIPFQIKTDYKTGVIVLPLPLEKIVPGNYDLKIEENNSSDTLHFKFKVIWEDMPLVLSKPKLAIQSMYYILTDPEYEKMLDADYDEYSKEILNYWEKHDPTPSTPFNEAMAEYFKRVDYAIFNFQTFTQKNGMKTDRGKIYILYGKPSEISKDFKGDKTYEVWNYKHLNKNFIFVRNNDDQYKLEDIVDKK